MDVISTVKALHSRVRDYSQRRGLIPWFARCLLLLQACSFQYEKFYLYEYAVRDGHNAEVIPSVKNINHVIVSSNRQADELVANGFEDFRYYVKIARKCLEKGGIASWIYTGYQFTNIHLIAMTNEAKNTFDPQPYRVDFHNNQVCVGGTFTVQGYRRRGLTLYNRYKRTQYLRNMGIITERYTVRADDIAVQNRQTRFGTRLYATACYLKILWWTHWKETPLTSSIQDKGPS